LLSFGRYFAALTPAWPLRGGDLAPELHAFDQPVGNIQDVVAKHGFGAVEVLGAAQFE
jgi:hypothetical protein